MTGADLDRRIPRLVPTLTGADQREISEEDAIALPRNRNMTHPLSATIVPTGHSARRDDNPPASSRDVIRTIEVNATDPFAPKADRSKPMATTASSATETTTRRQNGGSVRIYHQKINSDRATTTTTASAMAAIWQARARRHNICDFDICILEWDRRQI